MYRVRNQWVISSAQYNNYICHNGIKGQKWGIRRYENYDGTLTEEGKERYYGKYEYGESKIKKAANKAIDFMFDKDEEGRYKLSKSGKKVLVGTGITVGALAAATGAGVLIYKAGGPVQIANWAASTSRAVKNMPTERLREVINHNKERAFNIMQNRNPDGTPSVNKRNFRGAVRSMVNCTVARREYGKRSVETAIRNLLNKPDQLIDYMNTPQADQQMNTIFKTMSNKTIIGLLSVGTTAVVGAAALELKEELDRKDPTETKSRYMAPNPNKKK